MATSPASLASINTIGQLNDHELAAYIASGTGQLLVELRARLSSQGVDQKELKAAGDAAAHEHIVKILQATRPTDAILSEEGADKKERLSSERVWIVDPLDGTREFSEPPRVDWAVHIALVEGGTPIAAAVELPAETKTFTTEPALKLPPVNSSKPRVVVSRTRRPVAVQYLAEQLEAEYLEMGSAGAKAMAVVQGEADIYAHTGGQFEWDSCAPVGVAMATGLHCSRIDGSALTYNHENPYLPDLLICQPSLAERCLEILSNAPDV